MSQLPLQDTYQVIARKYRPQTFEDVVGQEPVVTTLKNAIKFHRLAHAYLFCGCRGTGKTTLARVFAKRSIAITYLIILNLVTNAYLAKRLSKLAR